MKQELQEISIDKIIANSSQPREEFDKEEIKELSKSIVSNGLINPIQVRVLKDGKYMIISGERRWRAHKLAGIKTIPAFVKEYDNDDWMVEGFIDNIQRTDLSSVEKAKYMKKLMDIKKLDVKGLSNILKITETAINSQLILLKDKEIMEYVANGELASAAAQSILLMPDRAIAKQLAKKVIKNDIGRTELRETIKVLNNTSDNSIKKALLEEDIDFKQAYSISKLKKPEQIKEAIQQHKDINKVSKRIEGNIKNVDKIRNSKEFNRQLLQAGNWITSFRGSVTDSSKSLEKTIKALLVSTKFVSIMDDKQKEQLNQQLDRFLEILEKAERLSNQIQEKIE